MRAAAQRAHLTCNPAQISLETPFPSLSASLAGRREAGLRICEEIVIIAYSCVTAVPRLRRSKDLAVLHPGLTAGPTHCRLFEAGLEMIGCLVLRSVGQANQAREAPAGSRHARKRVVACEKQNRGRNGRHNGSERFIHTFSDPPRRVGEAPHGVDLNSEGMELTSCR